MRAGQSRQFAPRSMSGLGPGSAGEPGINPETKKQVGGELGEPVIDCEPPPAIVEGESFAGSRKALGEASVKPRGAPN